MKYYLDCEFDGHNGPLLSMALVRDDGDGLHIQTIEAASDSWVIENVMPLMDKHEAGASMQTPSTMVGPLIAAFIGDDEAPAIVADSPVDIARFCQAISTAPDGGYSPCFTRRLSFEVHDLDCYPSSLPGAVQHNAWWDAMALRHLLSEEGKA